MSATPPTLHEDAIGLLLELPSALSQRTTRQHLLAQLRQRHPHMGIDLITVPRADGHHADHALLLRDPDGVVVKLAALRNQGEPWQVSTAEPWAADTLLSVEDEHLSIHSCILYLDDSLRGSGASQALELENRLLLQTELKQRDLPVEEADLDRLEHRFRRHHGLLARTSMLRWLEEKGLSYRDYRDLMALNLRLDLLRHQICGQQRQRWLGEHPQLQRCLLLSCCLPPCSDAQARQWLAEITWQQGSLSLSSRWLAQSQLRVELQSEWLVHVVERLQQPEGLEAGPSAAHGEGESPGQSWLRLEDGACGQQQWCRIVDQWSVATADPDLAELVDQLVFEDWLRHRRAQAKVRWHWP